GTEGRWTHVRVRTLEQDGRAALTRRDDGLRRTRPAARGSSRRVLREGALRGLPVLPGPLSEGNGGSVARSRYRRSSFHQRQRQEAAQGPLSSAPGRSPRVYSSIHALGILGGHCLERGMLGERPVRVDRFPRVTVTLE